MGSQVLAGGTTYALNPNRDERIVIVSRVEGRPSVVVESPIKGDKPHCVGLRGREVGISQLLHFGSLASVQPNDSFERHSYL